VTAPARDRQQQASELLAHWPPAPARDELLAVLRDQGGGGWPVWRTARPAA
jgi:hypothetical protein